ncbi:hypothetical protein [Microbacterium sp. 2FI]|uniref:hypothetical protein n=1 Tax=Microbacterium sp. 2FI TaxID=2502193 RepID=UPI0010F6AB02|nr:hypothetical protein [Microbacterium sp. 2FI]
MRELKLLTGKTVVISSTGATVRGVLESATRSFVTLVDAVDVSSTDPKPIAGMVLIPASRVNYVQAVA